MTTAFEALVNGQVLDATIGVYTSMMGTQIFWGILFATALGLVYMKTRNITLLGVTIMITASTMLTVIPGEFDQLMLVAIIMGVAMTMISIYLSKG